jgi:IS30 family transposase
MATNKKHLDSDKYGKALTLQDRVNIESIIKTNRNIDGSMSITLNSIGDMLEKDPTTISKEVKFRRTQIDMKQPNYKYMFQICSTCKKNSTCNFKQNNNTISYQCNHYEKYICKHLLRFPWVCNGCHKRGHCTSTKSYYNPIPANESYKYTLVDSRQGVYMTQKEFEKINTVISEGLKKRQSLEHILHSNDIPICVTTAYNYLHRGYFNADVLDTHRMTYLKGLDGHKPHNSKILKNKKVGRHYEDFLNLLAKNPDLTYSEMDTVDGVKGGKACLSLKIVKLQFQFYFIIDDKTASTIVNTLNKIQEIIGIENYRKIFGVILTDNGSEFTDIDGIIYDSITGELRTDLYFCHPQCSGEKGSCERNHELFRYILPKGISFNNLNQNDFNLITSHVNSLKRKSTDYSTPIELFYAFFGHEILEKLHISLIEPNSVILSPELLK